MGLIHLTTQSLTTGSLSIDNVFSSKYENYYYILTSTHSTGVIGRYRLRSSGTDNTTASSYTSRYSYFYVTTYGTTGVTTNDYGFFSINYDNGPCLNHGYIWGPYLAQPTVVNCAYVNDTSSQSTGMGNLTSIHNVTSSFDGITIYSTSGTFTGEISIYGLEGS